MDIHRIPSFEKDDLLIPSSDCESDCDDLEPDVMKLAKPELTDNKLSTPTVRSPGNRPKNLSINAARLSTSLTTNTDYPLMPLGSQDENFPDVMSKIEVERDLSLYRAEDERAINVYEFCSPESNNSTSRLNFSDNFLSESLNTPPDNFNFRDDDNCIIQIADRTMELCTPSPLDTSQLTLREEFHSLLNLPGTALSSTVRSFASLLDPDELCTERVWLTLAIDMKVIEPFQRVISHGGYCADGTVIIVFSACHLPERTRHDYSDVMHNLFLYVVWSLERMVTDEYVLVYLHGGADRRRMPSCTWLHGCYQLLDHRLRKGLKHLYLVHPTLWLKSFVFITKALVSSKFFRKLTYVRSLGELLQLVPVDPYVIPDAVKQLDERRQ